MSALTGPQKNEVQQMFKQMSQQRQNINNNGMNNNNGMGNNGMNGTGFNQNGTPYNNQNLSYQNTPFPGFGGPNSSMNIDFTGNFSKESLHEIALAQKSFAKHTIAQNYLGMGIAAGQTVVNAITQFKAMDAQGDFVEQDFAFKSEYLGSMERIEMARIDNQKVYNEFMGTMADKQMTHQENLANIDKSKDVEIAQIIASSESVDQMFYPRGSPVSKTSAWKLK